MAHVAVVPPGDYDLSGLCLVATWDSQTTIFSGFQKSVALLQTPNSRVLVIRTLTKGTRIYRNCQTECGLVHIVAVSGISPLLGADSRSSVFCWQ